MNFDSYKEDRRRFNKVLNQYVDTFKRKYSASINIKINFNEKLIDMNMIGIGADEVYMFKKVKQPMGSHYLQINNHIELTFAQEISYNYFEKALIKQLLFLKIAKRTCHLKKKH